MILWLECAGGSYTERNSVGWNWFAISCIGTTAFNWMICRPSRFCSAWKNVENITVTRSSRLMKSYCVRVELINFIGRNLQKYSATCASGVMNYQSSVALLPSGFEFVLNFTCLLELVGSFLGAIWLVAMFGSILETVVPFLYLEVVACQENADHLISWSYILI